MFSDTCNNVIPTPISNARGDSAEENLQVCTGIGTVLNYSITLQPRGAAAPRTLVQYSPSADVNDQTTLRWINDDTLSVDLGRVRWIRRKLFKVGAIRIAYSYTYSDVE